MDNPVDRLRSILAELPSVLVAFSGGVDSTFLLRVAHDTLGDRCTALTTLSSTTPDGDVTDARQFAAELGCAHILVDTNELAVPGYAENPTNRCYFCKDNLFAICAREAERRGIGAVVDGANVDDLRDHRPGLTAAAERSVRHPLVEAGFTKAEIRAASRALGLRAWDRPASPCLSSRFPYGTRITAERLARVAAAEQLVRALGIRELRVRFHDAVARIEVPAEAMPMLIAAEARIGLVERFRELGFAYVTLDLGGLRSGSLNDPLARPIHEGPKEEPSALRVR